eukprot:m.64996 g.64996  ORF g.64996 m.64996 type:complete len:53 (+) comp7549_c0_seq2:898-1056(+)
MRQRLPTSTSLSSLCGQSGLLAISFSVQFFPVTRPRLEQDVFLRLPFFHFQP